jgi:hypothetical protein
MDAGYAQNTAIRIPPRPQGENGISGQALAPAPRAITFFHQKFLYGLKPLPSGRFPLDARQSRVYLSGNPFLQGGGQSTRLLSAGVASSGGQSRMWIET